MRTWQPMTEPYRTVNGFTVKVAVSEAELEELGYALHNGLMMPEGRGVWADLCERGQRQIISVTSPHGDVISNSELKLANGTVRAIFVRGDQNRELVAGDPGYDAITEYLDKVNGNDISVNFDRASGSLQPPKSAVFSPFAVMMGLDRLDEVSADQIGNPKDDDGDLSWTALTTPYWTSNGLTISPMANRNELAELGIELENNLFIPTATLFMAQSCINGDAQLARVLDQDGNMVGMVEYHAVRGQLVAVSCRGFADSEPSPSMAKAAIEYAVAVNTNKVKPAIEIGANRFVDSLENVNIFDDAERPHGAAILPPALRESPYVTADDDDDYDGNEDEDEDEDWLEDAPATGVTAISQDEPTDTTEHLVAPQPATDGVYVEPWQGITENYRTGGLMVEIITEHQRIAAVGASLETDWAFYHDDLAKRCLDGSVQTACVVDQDGAILSHVELYPANGAVTYRFHQGFAGKPASLEAMMAVKTYLQAIETDPDLKVNARIGNKNFYFDPPKSSLTM